MKISIFPVKIKIMSMLNSGKPVDTCLILNKRGDLALDMQPGGYSGSRQKTIKASILKSII